jgi:hypothetical protein
VSKGRHEHRFWAITRDDEKFLQAPAKLPFEWGEKEHAMPHLSRSAAQWFVDHKLALTKRSRGIKVVEVTA